MIVRRSSRRAFLKASLSGAILLGAGALWPGRTVRATERGGLTAEDRDLIRALAGTILRGSLPPDAQGRARGLASTVTGVERAIAHQPAHIRAELRELFDLMHFALARLLLCGFWRPWSEAQDEDIDAFLTWWRNSRIELLRLSYISLQELIASSYFSDPMSWARIGYEGPPHVERPAGASG